MSFLGAPVAAAEQQFSREQLDQLMVAWPARYGDTGVMTFIVSRDAVVYEKDLGPQTASIARAMKAYEPDATWKKADIND